MKFLSPLVVLFLLFDQLLAMATPFSSGLGLILFITAICITVAPELIQKPHKLSKFVTAIPRSAIIWSFIVCAFSLMATIKAPCDNQLLFSLLTTFLVIGTWCILKAFIPRLKSEHIIEPTHALGGLLVIYLFLCSAALGFDLYSFLQHAATNRPSGLYIEPSHLVLYSSSLMFVAISHQQTRILGILLTVFIFVLAYSATFMLFAGLISMVYILHSMLSSHQVIRRQMPLLTLAVIALFAISLHGTYLKDRLELNNETRVETRNFSTLVYLNGWLLAKATILKTSGMGLGLGNMGCSELINNDTQTLSASIKTLPDKVGNINGKIICVRDGSFLASKVMSELGIFGFILLSLLGFQLLCAFKQMLKNEFDLTQAGTICLVVSLFFIRGLPYFSAPVVYCLAMLIIQEKRKVRI